MSRLPYSSDGDEEKKNPIHVEMVDNFFKVLKKYIPKQIEPFGRNSKRSWSVANFKKYGIVELRSSIERWIKKGGGGKKRYSNIERLFGVERRVNVIGGYYDKKYPHILIDVHGGIMKFYIYYNQIQFEKDEIKYVDSNVPLYMTIVHFDKNNFVIKAHEDCKANSNLIRCKNEAGVEIKMENIMDDKLNRSQLVNFIDSIYSSHDIKVSKNIIRKTVNSEYKSVYKKYGKDTTDYLYGRPKKRKDVGFKKTARSIANKIDEKLELNKKTRLDYSSLK